MNASALRPALSLRDAYDMGVTVARHSACQSARDRIEVADRLDGALRAAYELGRERAWRMGE